jgi:hypothetical protein
LHVSIKEVSNFHKKISYTFSNDYFYVAVENCYSLTLLSVIALQSTLNVAKGISVLCIIHIRHGGGGVFCFEQKYDIHIPYSGFLFHNAQGSIFGYETFYVYPNDYPFFRTSGLVRLPAA